MTPIIDIQDLSFRYDHRIILDHVSLRLEQRDYLALLGPNGSGKTTLLKILLGLLEPQSGSVRILGEAPKQARGRIGYVPQTQHFDSQFPIRVFDVVLMGRLRRGKGLKPFSRTDDAQARDALKKLEIQELADRSIHDLSGGQLQRVLIARALAMQPALLLLDEPTASLDTKIGREFYELLAELAKDVTIILVTHDIGVISKHVQSVACLNRKLHFHASKAITPEILEEVYGCPVDLLAHGHPHRVLDEHS